MAEGDEMSELIPKAKTYAVDATRAAIDAEESLNNTRAVIRQCDPCSAEPNSITVTVNGRVEYVGPAQDAPQWIKDAMNRWTTATWETK